MERTIREQLNELVDEKYKIFTSSLNPGKDNILGVRLPLLKKMAAKLAIGDWKTYLSQSKDDTMEEVMLQGMVIGFLKIDIEDILELAAEFIPKIDCWSVCDSFCSGLKITLNHRSRVWEFLQPYLNSNQEYEIRFGVVMILNYYVLPEYAPAAFMQFNHISHEGYYVKMAVAWAISIYYIKLPEVTMEYLKQNDLDDFTYNKAIQKVTESLRVDLSTKAILRNMKRNKRKK